MTRVKECVLYRGFEHGEILDKMTALMDACEKSAVNAKEMEEDFYECVNGLIETAGSYGFAGNLWHNYLTLLLVNNENAFSTASEIRGHIDGSINELALHDFAIFKELYDFDLNLLDKVFHTSCCGILCDYQAPKDSGKMFNKRIRDRICEMSRTLAAAKDTKEFMEDMVQFYKDFGVGKLGLHKAFRIEKDENGKAQIVPITRIAHVRLDDLVGYEIPKQKLIENTEAFVRGRKANNCLLFGDAGTGKSSSIKGILNQYYDEGLRIIEAYKHQFQDLNEIIAQIKDRNYKFIIYMDDLSFEEFEIEYKYLKAVIEGGLERKPDNILIYATSNRRHLVRERANWKLEIVTISTPLIPYRKNFLWYIVLAFVSTSVHQTVRNSTRSSRHWQPVMASRCRKTSSLRKLANGRSLMEDLPEELHSSLLITFSEKRKTNR